MKVRCSPASRGRTTTTARSTPGRSSARRCSLETIAASPRGRRPARRLRLQRRERRLGGRHHLPRRGRPPLHRLAAVREGAGVRRRAGRRSHRPGLRLHHLRGGRCARPRTPTAQAGITDPRGAAGDGRGARLLHADRAGAHGGSRFRRARHGVEGGAGRDLRPRRRAARSTPTGASRASATRSAPPGLRMLFECWLQLRRQAPPERQIASVAEGGRTLGLTHNLGGAPGRVRELRRRGGDRAVRLSLSAVGGTTLNDDGCDPTAESEDQTALPLARPRRAGPGGGTEAAERRRDR